MQKENTTITVNFWISKGLLEAVDALLEGKNKTRSSFIMDAIEAHFQGTAENRGRGPAYELVS